MFVTYLESWPLLYCLEYYDSYFSKQTIKRLYQRADKERRHMEAYYTNPTQVTCSKTAIAVSIKSKYYYHSNFTSCLFVQTRPNKRVSVAANSLRRLSEFVIRESTLQQTLRRLSEFVIRANNAVESGLSVDLLSW